MTAARIKELMVGYSFQLILTIIDIPWLFTINEAIFDLRYGCCNATWQTILAVSCCSASVMIKNELRIKKTC